MQDHDIESLNHLRAVYSGKIDRLMCPQAEISFREYAAAVTAPCPGERVQSSRTSEHAERLTDMILEFEQERDRRVKEWEKIVSRIDQAIDEQEKYLSYSKALRWIFEE